MTWLMGVGLSIAATICGTFGKVLMKLSHIRGGDMIVFTVAIIMVMVLNPFLDALSYGYAAQSILAPMSGLSVVWNILLSPYLLKESLRNTDLIGTVFVVLGCAIVGASGDHKEPKESSHQIFTLFTSDSFLAYMIFLVVWTAALYFVITHSRSAHLKRFAYGSLAGTIGGNFFFIKAFVELAKNGDAWRYPFTYVILVAALLSAGSGLWILNNALRHYEAIYIVSVYQSFLILIGSVSGVVFFSELDGMPMLQLVCYMCGLITTVIGIRILSSVDEKDSSALNFQGFTDEKEPLIGAPRPHSNSRSVGTSTSDSLEPV